MPAIHWLVKNILWPFQARCSFLHQHISIVPSFSFLPRLRLWLAATENQLLLLLLVLAAFPLYYELGRNPIQLWDESRLAVNAFEMSRDSHWLVPQFNGVPDHWNTKPPLLIWFEAISFKMFGYSALALRLPVAIANLVTVLMVFRFGSRTLRQPLAGFFGALVLVTCSGFVQRHIARTGDYDALLTCWVTLGWIQFFHYLETANRRHLLWCAAAITAATLTKSIAGLLVLPGLFLYALVQRRLLWLLRQPVVYVAGLGWLVIVAGYYLGREAVDPGYWAAVKQNDLGGRLLDEQGPGNAYWSFYLENIFNSTFRYWLWAAVTGLLLGLLQKGTPVHRAVWLLLAVVVGWLLVISSAANEYLWYDAPIYPAMALLAGIGLAVLFRDVLGRYQAQLPAWQYKGLQLGIGLLVLLLPYRAIIRQIIEERYSDYGEGVDGHLARYLVTLSKQHPELDSLTVLRNGGSYNAVFDFYKHVHNIKPGHQMVVGGAQYGPTLPPGTVVVLCNPAHRVPLDSAFRVVALDQREPCQTLLLLPKP